MFIINVTQKYLHYAEKSVLSPKINPSDNPLVGLWGMLLLLVRFFFLWTIFTLITYCLSGRASFYCLSCNWFFCCATQFHLWSLLEGIRYICPPDCEAWPRYLVRNSSCCTWRRQLQYQSCGEFNNFGLLWESIFQAALKSHTKLFLQFC